MKRILSILAAALLAFSLAACASTDSGTQAQDTVAGAATDQTITAEEATGEFSMTSADGAFTEENGVYTVTSAGTYSLSGLLEGQIIVSAGEDDEVVLELNGATVSCDTDSPIKVISADKVEISAQKGTENVINDNRSPKGDAEDETQGSGAISADCDLKIKGKGTLVVNAGYNNGICTTKDLKIQNLSLKCVAYNNSLKGNDSVTVTSGTVVAVSTNGDGIKTENTDVNKSGVTRGDVTVSGGSLCVYAAGDGVQAAHNFEMTTGEEGVEPSLEIYTGSYSGYTASDAATTSYKGIKVQNELSIASGSVTLQTYDDGLHADAGESFDDGTVGAGNVNISGGTVTMNVYAPANKTATGRKGPDAWGAQQSVIGADGIHADGTLNVTGGKVGIDSAYEGLEANVINVSGGETRVSANDDGVNACKGDAEPLVNVTGGYLEVTVSPSGDTDGIDSNGSYTQSGGVVIARGPNSEMAGALDADGSVTVSGGTLIVLGYSRVSTAGSVSSVSLSLHSEGEHTVTVDGTSYTFTNGSDYGATACYTDAAVS